MLVETDDDDGAEEEEEEDDGVCVGLPAGRPS